MKEQVEQTRACVMCEETNLGGPYPDDVRVCRRCELVRHQADLEHLTPERFVAGSGWRLAKTMLDAPHQYTVRDLRNPDAHQTTAMGHAEFEWFARLISAEGKPGRWGQSTYIYYKLGGWEYWTMGNPPEVTTIINRRAKSAGAQAILDEQHRSRPSLPSAQGKGDIMSDFPTEDVKRSIDNAELQARGRRDYEEVFREDLRVLRDEAVASGAPASVEWIFFTAPRQAWLNECGTEGWLLVDPEDLRQYRYLAILMS